VSHLVMIDDPRCIIQVTVIVEWNVDQVECRSWEVTDRDDGFIFFTEAFDDLVDQKRELKKAKKEIETAIRQVDNEIINELGKRKASIGIAPRNIISWKLVSTKRMNSKKLAEKYPEVAKDEEIYNVTESRRLTEKEIK